MEMLNTNDFPRAEWLQAKEVLMHTPGEEIFDGVIHSAAGLFEDYFDVDQAAAEHRHYMDVLSDHGICIHTVDGILQEVDLDSLRSLAEDVLAYDISGIPGEDPARTEDFREETISKMSRTDLIRCILLRPTVKLFRTSGNTGYEAKYILNPLMNLYFTRDQSVTTPRGHVICHMNSSQRAAETSVIALCYNYLGRKPILRIEGEGRLEGGDYIPAGDVAFIGCGMRTNDEGIRQMMQADAFGHDTVAVVRDRKLRQAQMHLDTWFNIIDRDLCAMARSRMEALPSDAGFITCDIWTRWPGTVDYFPARKDVPFVDYLREIGMEIIPIEYDDEKRYASNFLTVAPRRVIAVAGQSAGFGNSLEKAGVRVEWIRLDNLIRGFGAAHCMTQVIKRSI